MLFKLEYPNITVMCVQCTDTYSGGRLVHLDNVNFLSRIDLLCFTDCYYYSWVGLPCTKNQKVAIYKLWNYYCLKVQKWIVGIK